jgi:hypothetical protein
MQNCLRTCHVETVYVLWNYVLSLRTCHVETVYVLWRNYVLNDFKVLHKMLYLYSFKTWFSNCMISTWYSSEIYIGQAQNIEHVI